MKKMFIIIFSSLLILPALTETACGQRYPERRLIREGNRDYEKGRYIDSEVDYRRALEKTPGSYEAAFNLGNSLYKQERFDEAAQTYSRLDSLNKDNMAAAHYNAGNALLKQRKLDEAIEEYKKSLRINPDDREAKFNLAYAKKLRDQDKNDDQQDQNNKDDKNNQDNKNDQNKDKQDKQDDQNKDKQDKGGEKQPPKPEQQQQQETGMSKEEAEHMLEAVQMNEDKTREKMDEKKAKAVGRSEKNW